KQANAGNNNGKRCKNTDHLKQSLIRLVKLIQLLIHEKIIEGELVIKLLPLFLNSAESGLGRAGFQFYGYVQRIIVKNDGEGLDLFTEGCKVEIFHHADHCALSCLINF